MIDSIFTSDSVLWDGLWLIQYSLQIQCCDSDWDGLWLIQYLFQIQWCDSDWDGLWLIQYLFQIQWCDSDWNGLWLIQYLFLIQYCDSDWDGLWLIQYFSLIQYCDSGWDGLWLIQYIFQIQCFDSDWFSIHFRFSAVTLIEMGYDLFNISVDSVLWLWLRWVMIDTVFFSDSVLWLWLRWVMIDYDSDRTRIMCCSLLMYMTSCNNWDSDRDQVRWWTILPRIKPKIELFCLLMLQGRSPEAVCAIGCVIIEWAMSLSRKLEFQTVLFVENEENKVMVIISIVEPISSCRKSTQFWLFRK